MGRMTIPIFTVALAVAACTGAASPSGIATPASPAPAPSQAVASPPATTPPVKIIEVKATFDGKTCTYSGPAAVPMRSFLHWTLENTPGALKVTKGAALIVAPVVAGTTWEQVVKDTATLRQSDIPTWAVVPGAGTNGLDEIKVLLPAEAALGNTLYTEMTRTAYYVGCGTAADDTDTPYPAALVTVLPS